MVPLPYRPLVAMILFGLFPGCRDQITYIECPLGTLPSGDHCEPIPASPEPPIMPISETVGGGDGALVEDGTGENLDIGPGQTDVGNPPSKDTTVMEQVVVGAPCIKDDDCGEGLCLDWPGGYCTTLDCEEAGCPEGSRCALLKGGNSGCLADCADETPCPQEGQGCKLLPGLDGEMSPLCYGLYDDSGGVGAPCEDHAACEDAATCLASFPGGYCAVQGCGPDTCPPGSACFVFADVPTCLAMCDDVEDCATGPEAERRCSVLQDVSGQPTGACISAAGGQQIGEQCLNDFECESGTCETLGEGTCSQTAQPCFTLTAGEDCGADEFCLITGDNQVGACTQPCSVWVPCPGASLCQGAPGPAEGWCRPPCAGLGAADDCRTEAGFQCTYGFALGDSTGQGRYLCMLGTEGKMGDPCGPEVPCSMGGCELTDETTGSCYVPCGDDLYCPFPGLCVTDGAFGACVSACSSDADCQGSTTCVPGQGTLGPVCVDGSGE